LTMMRRKSRSFGARLAAAAFAALAAGAAGAAEGPGFWLVTVLSSAASIGP
jgi:ABC-type sugar transport system substrate-binding protein